MSNTESNTTQAEDVAVESRVVHGGDRDLNTRDNHKC